MREEWKTQQWGDHLVFVAMQVLHENDGGMSRSDVLKEVRERECADMPERMKGKTPSGRIRWVVAMMWQSIEFTKAGFLRKEGGIWHLTPEGAQSLSDGEDETIQSAKAMFKEWRKLNPKTEQKIAEGDENDDGSLPGDRVENYQSEALGEIQEHVRRLGPYEFQDLCAALLRGMGYHVRDVAPPGRDGGIDILAYVDPLGGRPPRLKVQVKHTGQLNPQRTSAGDLRELAGLLTDGDIGVFISSRGFASGCRDFARNCNKHLELIDSPRFIDLWEKHYDKLSEEDKALLPLLPVYFLDAKRAVND